ncbi:MAG: 3-keto-disaccharide hydrolase [Thermoguttaceae bacterium]
MKLFAPFLSVMLIFAIAGFAIAADPTVQVDDEGFVSLFNGKDLSNWEGNPDIWRVEEGCIVGETANEGPKKITKNTFLILKDKEYSDFVLKFEYRLTKEGNSGVQYRSWIIEDETPFRVGGYQADFDGNNTYTGILYGENYRGILAKRGEESEIGDDHQPKTVREFAKDRELKRKIKVEDWNDYVVTAKDFTFTKEINGNVMSICNDKDAKERRKTGLIAIQAHVGPAMKVEIRNIKIKELEK